MSRDQTTDSSDTSEPQQPDLAAELDPVGDRYANIVCGNCIHENGPFDHFCSRCGMPLTAYATIAPLEQVYTLGHGFQKATDRPTRPIIFYGLWFMLGPQVLLVVIPSFTAIGNKIWNALTSPTVDTFEVHIDWFGATFVTSLTAIYITILYKATRNYLRHRYDADSHFPSN